jgi:DNA-directed RNA polymerase subunit RPC12/RpoP
MLITTACPSCAAQLTISSHTKGKMISCINCGHRFIVDEVTDPPSVELQVAASSQRDWKDEPPAIRSQQPAEQPDVIPSDENWNREAGASELGELDDALSEASEENRNRHRSPDRTRVKFAVLGGLFSIVSLACLWAGIYAHLLPWFYGSAASAYVGAHLSIFSKGPIRIVGAVLNIAVLLGCIASLIFLRGLIRIEWR